MAPVVLQRAVRRAYEDDFRIRTESGSVEALREELRDAHARRNGVLAGAAVFLGGVLWLTFATPPAWVGWGLLALGGALLAFRR
jgi:hypothetical protein